MHFAIGRFALILLLVPVIFVIFGCGGDLPQRTVAQVGTALVSREQFEDLEAAYRAAGRVPDETTQPKEYRTFTQNLAQYLVMLEVLRQKAPEYGITITEQDVNAQVADVKEMFQGDKKRFEDSLKKQKLTLDQLKESLRQQLLIDEMKAAVTKDVTVTEDEVRSYYDGHKGDYTTPEVRTVRHILIDPHPEVAEGEKAITPTEGDWELAREQADSVRSEIQNGADFGSTARKYSDDDATKDDGGELGRIIGGQMVPDFEEAVFSLKKGELSRPVRTEYGYHLIQVTDITPEKPIPYDQVKEKIRRALLESRRAATWDQWLQSVQKELKVVYSSGFEPSAKANTTSTMIPLTTTTTASTLDGPDDGE